jgi:hypothetical protein
LAMALGLQERACLALEQSEFAKWHSNYFVLNMILNYLLGSLRVD